MPTNLDRKVVVKEELTHGSLELYDTGAFYYYDRRYNALKISITHATLLFEAGFLHKLINILYEPEAAEFAAEFSTSMIENNNKNFEAVEQIISNEDLKPSAKLIYFIALSKLKHVMSKETLDLVFKKRPDPYSEAKSILGRNGRTNTRIMEYLKYSFYPNFEKPFFKLEKTEEAYKQFCRAVAFLDTKTKTTYKDFVEAHEENFFIPSTYYDTATLQNLEKVLTVSYTGDFYPSEYERYAKYFSVVPKELRAWQKTRFLTGAVLVQELNAKGKDLYNKELKLATPSTLYTSIADNLTLNEALDFASYFEDSSILLSKWSRISTAMASMLAFVFVEGGKHRLEELMLHIQRSLEKESALEDAGKSPIRWNEPLRFYSLTENWKNPYAIKASRKVDFNPYIKAFTDDVLKDMPLDWALAIA